MEPLVSIIVPVYNLEGYVTNCLNSLVNQTYRNLEILCIDDGSTDKSADVIKAFAEKDDRVIYLYKENGGVSSARNMGLDMFKGEYVMFVDGDDYLHPQAVELFVNCIVKTRCDIACAVASKTCTYINKYPEIDKLIFEEIGLEDLFVPSEVRAFSSVWSKLYRRDFLNGFKFPLGIKYGEDTNFLFKVLGQNPKLARINTPLYFYYIREMSAETSPFGLNKATVLDAYDDICKYFLQKENTVLKSLAYHYLFKTICYIRTVCIGTDYEDVVLMQCKNLGKKWIGEFLRLDNVEIKTKIIVSVFFYSHFFYEFIRLVLDPTMLDFYKNRRKHNGKSQKD